MAAPKDYVKDIQKFITSHYWNSGVRITAGVILPMFVMLYYGWLSNGITFLFGALFVSLTDTPGPIHHRTNGMIAAIALNTVTVLITSILYEYQPALLIVIIACSFLFSFLAIYGARAGAIGTLALVIMLIHMSPVRHEQSPLMSMLLTASGGIWYTSFSLLLYRIQPYRIVEQALGEYLMLIASYIRARAAFYKEDPDIDATFYRVMKEQVDVLKSQEQIRELLFKTRQLVGDANPRSRSLMMIFLESLDLFEETMYSYQDYKKLHEHVDRTLIQSAYKVILQVVAELEHTGLMIQSGLTIRKMPVHDEELTKIEAAIQEKIRWSLSADDQHYLQALNQTIQNIRSIDERLIKIISYTRMEAHDPDRFPDQDLEKPGAGQTFTITLFRENLNLRSNHFRYSVRLTIALVVGYCVSALFALSHAYWVMLTVLTILKPVYNLTRKRNIERVLGTLLGVLMGSVILFIVVNNTVLIALMIISMLFAYSLLRLHYLGFVTFLTIYIVITFHFLNPLEFKTLIGERLVDTLIGSVIAGITGRFIFPAWQHYQVIPAMKKMLISNTTYLLAAWNIRNNPAHQREYNTARNEAIVALTNLSDNFQQMLAEPGSSMLHEKVHQFVIANHMLCNRISALTPKDLLNEQDIQPLMNVTLDHLELATANLEKRETSIQKTNTPSNVPPSHPLSVILSLARDIRSITANGITNA